MTLNVFLYDNYVGTLSSKTEKGLVFLYDKEYISKNNLPLSLSLPLRETEYHNDECLSYFSGLLLEGNKRQKIADYNHVSVTNIVRLLKILGRECAGAVSFYDKDNFSIEEARNNIKSKETINENNYIKLSDKDLASLINGDDIRPLILGENELIQTLAGNQNKIALTNFNNSWYLPINGAPSTHILKPSNPHFTDLSINEYICLKLAEEFKINTTENSLKTIDGIPVLISKRYDRIIDEENKTITKLHQEDICQALNIYNIDKYEKDGGPSLKDTYNLLKDNCTTKLKTLSIFIRVIVFNYLIGNCDAHGKNFSLLYKDSNTISLAPFYDLLSTQIYKECSTTMAMKIGEEYNIKKVTIKNFIEEANSLNIKSYVFLDEIEYFNDTYVEAFNKIEELEELKDYKDLVQQIKKNFIEKLDKLQC